MLFRQRVVVRLLDLGQGGINRLEAAQIEGELVGQLHCRLDPFPALGEKAIALGGELFAHHAHEEIGVLQPPVVILLEQIAHDDAAGRHIRIDSHEAGARIARFDAGFGEEAPDVEGVGGDLAPRDRVEHLRLARMVVGDAEGHQLLEIELIGGVGVEQLRACRSELQALAHHGGRDAECGRDVFLALVLVAECCEGAELVERVQRLAVGVLGETVVLRMPVVLTMQGMGASLARRFCFTSSLRARKRRPPGLHLVGCRSRFASASRTGRTLKDCSRPRRAMLSARASMEMAALTRRTLRVAEDELVEGNAGGLGESELGFGSHGKPPVGTNGSRRKTLSQPLAVTGFPSSLFLSLVALEAKPDDELQRGAMAGEHCAVEGMTRRALLPVGARFGLQLARRGPDHFAVAREDGDAEPFVGAGVHDLRPGLLGWDV